MSTPTMINKNTSLNIGIVGATGMVGQVFLKLLEERSFPIASLKLFASEVSKGKLVNYQKQTYQIECLQPGCFDGLDLVFFSSGEDISKEWAPQAMASGAFAIDNSSAFRHSKDHLLCVPEINGDQLPDTNTPALIANPNCSTIQLVMALKPIASTYTLKKVKVSSYQAVSGAGQVAMDEMHEQFKSYMETGVFTQPKAFPHNIAFNSLPQIGSFNDQGYCDEEDKIMFETKKILGLNDLTISAFTVRVPMLNAHSESVWFTLEQDVVQADLEACLSNFPGLKYIKQNKDEDYPHALMAADQDDVFVGRLHKDQSETNTWIFWVVADNLRKGAALNGLQIAEQIFDIK